MSDLPPDTSTSPSSPIPSSAASSVAENLGRQVDEAREKLERLQRDAKAARVKEALKRVEQGALPVVQVLPVPEHDGSFDKVPTLFARVPIFSCAKPKPAPPQGHLIETSFGRVVRHGPGLTMEHEDIYMTVYRLCRHRLEFGPKISHRALSLVPKDGDVSGYTAEQLEQMLAPVRFVAGSATYYQIANDLNYARASAQKYPGGSNIYTVRNYMKEIGLSLVEIWRKDLSRFVITPLFLLSGDEGQDGKIGEGSGFTVYYPEGIVDLMNVYTIQDMRIRHRLSPTGKAIYRFVASQLWSKRPEGRFRLDMVQACTGSNLTSGNFKVAAREDFCEPIKELGWAEMAHIEGSGRKTPFELCVRKRIGRPKERT